MILHAHASSRRLLWLLLSLVTVTTGACRPESGEKKRTEPAPAKAEAPAAEQPFEMHGIGGVEGENPAFDQSRQPAKFIAALAISPGQRIADVGAGLGYYTVRLSEAVGPTGQVVATDIDDDALAKLRARVSERKNIEVRKVPADDPGLEPGKYDLILLSEVDHFFADRVAYLTKLRAALTPNGRIAVTHLRAMRPPLVAAAQTAGYTIVSEYNDLPQHYLLFLQPASSQ
ncbi:class I SAM-dependent methyltransferase [Hyalangium versicolor]|uniref:class I SAM-dependent methyltransferase n=1 Tax=Hyalangium versicolor TaxID=2861190 RepID=UPI001CCA117B|nr:class I SAM-dependent methyltransferase [Hyalangium versicolor]